MTSTGSAKLNLDWQQLAKPLTAVFKGLLDMIITAILAVPLPLLLGVIGLLVGIAIYWVWYNFYR
jgi:hypothetical protein